MMKSSRGHSLGKCIRIENAGLKKLNQSNVLQQRSTLLHQQGMQQVQTANVGFQQILKQQGGGGTTRLYKAKQQRRTQRRARGSASSAPAA